MSRSYDVEQRRIHVRGQASATQRFDDVVGERQPLEVPYDNARSRARPERSQPSGRRIIDGRLMRIEHDSDVPGARRRTLRIGEQFARQDSGVRDGVRCEARIAVRRPEPLAQNRIPPQESVRRPQRSACSEAGQRTRQPRDAKERRNAHAPRDGPVLREPCTQKPTGRKADDDNFISQFGCSS